MEELVESDVSAGVLVEGLTRSSYGNESVSYETDILAKMDSCWDDIENDVIVSRMVSDSVIKGMVGAVAEEASERITLMETELAFLKERLQFYESDARKGNESDSPSLTLEARKTVEDMSKNQTINACTVASEALVQETHEYTDEMVEPLVSSAKMQQLEHEIHSLIKSLQDDFETRSSERKGLINVVNKKWQEKVGKLSSTRQEIDVVCKALLSSDLGQHLSRSSSVGNFEDCITVKSKDHLVRKVLSMPLEVENGIIKPEESGKPMLSETLKGMTNDQLIAYFKAEMTKMKRQHDIVLQEKTEELFTVKRDFLKEKGSTPFYFRRDKEFDTLLKKLPEYMSKLSDIRLVNEDLPIIHKDQSMLCSLKEKIDILVLENQQLHCFLKNKLKERRCFTSQASDVESPLCHSPREDIYAEQIKELQSDAEDVKIEADLGDGIFRLVLGEVTTEFVFDMEGKEMAAKTEQDMYFLLCREASGDALSSIKPFIAESQQQMSSIAAKLTEKERALNSQIEENRIVKQEMDSLSALLEEKEKLASEVGSALEKEKEQFGIVCQELNKLTEQVNEKEGLLLESKIESDMIRERLDEAMEQIHQYEVKMSDVNDKLKSMSNAFEEAEKQKLSLANDHQEKQSALASALTKEEEQEKWMRTIISSMSEFSNAVVDSESLLLGKINANESRLGSMKHQCIQLVQQGNLLKTKELWYKQRLERQCSDLEKAEREVDLLGDDVDTLLRLLKKIHMALEHYSPVLQHYPGVVEILKLIKREMKSSFA